MGEKRKAISSSRNTFMKNSRPFLKEWFFDCIKSRSGEEQIRLRLAGLGVSLPESGYICAIIDFDKKMIIDDARQFELFTDIERALKNLNDTFLSFFEISSFLYVFCVQSDQEKKLMEVAFEKAEQLKKCLQQKKCIHYSIGIGLPVFSIEEIDVSYQLAIEASKYRYSLGDEQIIFINDIKPSILMGDYHIIRQEDFITSIKNGNEEMMEQILQQIFSDMMQHHEPIHMVKRVCLEVMVYTSRAIYEMGQNPSMLFEKTDLWSVINRCTSIEQLKNLIINTNKVAISQLFSRQESKNKKLIEKAKRLVDEHTNDKISLEWVAEQLYISPCYLSILFGKETGMTFKEYLIKSRLFHAKELLLNEHYKIYQIAKMVGYSDARYFSDLFRKYEGLTPFEYRKKVIISSN